MNGETIMKMKNTVDRGVLMRVDTIQLERVMKQMDQYQYETGAIIGSDSSGTIGRFFFDQGKETTTDVYSPDTNRLNSILDGYHSKGIEFRGMMHSHRSKCELSYADIEYAVSILNTNHLKSVFMPVYVLDTRQVFWYKVDFNSITYYTITKEGNLMEKENRKVELPEGRLCAYCCGDCGWSEPSERDERGRIWCSRNRAYYYPGESSGNCSGYFTRRN